jgi:hypothetical protein
MAEPMPPDPPVIIAIFPSSGFMVFLVIFVPNVDFVCLATWESFGYAIASVQFQGISFAHLQHHLFGGWYVTLFIERPLHWAANAQFKNSIPYFLAADAIFSMSGTLEAEGMDDLSTTGVPISSSKFGNSILGVINNSLPCPAPICLTP